MLLSFKSFNFSSAVFDTYFAHDPMHHLYRLSGEFIGKYVCCNGLLLTSPSYALPMQVQICWWQNSLFKCFKFLTASRKVEAEKLAINCGRRMQPLCLNLTKQLKKTVSNFTRILWQQGAKKSLLYELFIFMPWKKHKSASLKSTSPTYGQKW